MLFLYSSSLKKQFPYTQRFVQQATKDELCIFERPILRKQNQLDQNRDRL